MDDALEARSQRIRHYLRRPLASRGDLLNENARNTVTETDPGSQLIADSWVVFGYD
jgi:hypothetical protein